MPDIGNRLNRAWRRRDDPPWEAEGTTMERMHRITHSYALAITQIYAPDFARYGA